MGEIIIEAPEFKYCPLHPSQYHFHTAPVPATPPVKVTVVDCPEHTDEGDALTPDAEVDNCIIETFTVEQAVVLQSPSART